jgi:hypothetical protein
MTISMENPPPTDVHRDEQILRSPSRRGTGGSRSTGVAIVEPALAFCEAYGNLDEPDGVDQLMALVSDGIVIEDVVLGESYRGRDDVRAYVTGLYDTFAIDDAVCPYYGGVQGASWAAGTYELYAGNAVLSQGIGAIQVGDDGPVERQVNFFTPSPDGSLQPTIDSGTGVFAVGSQYCRAWGDGMSATALDEAPDPDRILSWMPAEPTIDRTADGATTITGAAEIRTFSEGTVWDGNECSYEVRAVQAVQWEAVANRFFDDDTGTIWEGVNVIALDENKLVTDHWPFLELVS